MPVLKIVWSYDENDCDTPGCSGGYDEGAVAYLGDKLIYDDPAAATCTGRSRSREDVLYEIIKAMDVEIVEEDAPYGT